MASETEICNMALSHLGTGKEINIRTESSEEAAACRRFYKTARDSVLEDFPQPFSKTYTTLNLIQEKPNKEWDYLYRYPVNCLKIRRILTGSAWEVQESKIPYQISSDTAGKLIYTNEPEAQIEFTRRVEIPALHTNAFNLALSFRLAAYVAPRLTQGDPTKIKNDMIFMYQAELGNARSNSINEEEPYMEPESSLIRTRNK